MASVRRELQTERGTLEEIERAIMQISWLAQRQFMQLLDDERFRLTLPQFYTLIHLQHVGEECKMSDLADATHQSAASLTGVVDRLVEKQLIERSRHKHDRRQVMVCITARGIALISEIRHARREQMQMALGQLSEDEVDTFQLILDQVLAGMQRVTEYGENRRLA
nr:MarR family transcriptional regulator [Oscillochloris trichoides]